ncbi:hypothetical protein TIFTF001_025099 [Ficus carica]|uniref:Uncharacterized protein n=1 Tax=Ficus carica TaxID=3494 RepID=A0AA88AME3_FICCA|nr:hypothetical protein TIFTF001_025099 [Ficus carica]
MEDFLYHGGGGRCGRYITDEDLVKGRAEIGFGLLIRKAPYPKAFQSEGLSGCD